MRLGGQGLGDGDWAGGELGPGFEGIGRGGVLTVALGGAELVERTTPFSGGGFVTAVDLQEGVGAFAIFDVGCAHWVFVGGVLLGDEGVEDLGFEAAHAALGPVGGDDFVEEERLFGTLGLELPVVIGGEFGEDGVVFAGDDVRLSRSSVLQSIEAGGGRALVGAGAGGLLRVEAVREYLGRSSHNSTVAGEIGAGRGLGAEVIER